ncbi:techylectin-5A-like [Clavelina lepadiformis]|uniref:techylectin-5A-like n=1 Tax=Clavelina lepadiformis TaxID=159417 RepID=UPI004041B342
MGRHHKISFPLIPLSHEGTFTPLHACDVIKHREKVIVPDKMTSYRDLKEDLFDRSDVPDFNCSVDQARKGVYYDTMKIFFVLFFYLFLQDVNFGLVTGQQTQVTVEQIEGELTSALKLYLELDEGYANYRNAGSCAESMQELRHKVDEVINSKNDVNVTKVPANETFFNLLRIQQNFFTGCDDVYKRGYRSSGVYPIWLKRGYYFVHVHCDMDFVHPLHPTRGWVTIQRREDGSISFRDDKEVYETGFGLPSGEHWVGNYNLYNLMARRRDGDVTLRVRLRIDVEDDQGMSGFAEYDDFVVGENNLTVLSLGSKSGTVPNLMLPTLNRPFYVNGTNSWGSYDGGWWFDEKWKGSNLNGPYINFLNVGVMDNKAIYVADWGNINPETPSLTRVSMKLQFY